MEMGKTKTLKQTEKMDQKQILAKNPLQRMDIQRWKHTTQTGITHKNYPAQDNQIRRKPVLASIPTLLLLQR